MKTSLSACIIAMNEEDRIADCLRSVAFCDEILVVDSHSTDKTRELARSLGARVIERDWPGHVAQKEFTIREAGNDWVLCVDADERVTPALRAEIEELREHGFPGRAGWRCPRLVNYLGTWVRHGTWYPDLQLRLFDRRRARWGGHNPHDRVELEDGIARGAAHGADIVLCDTAGRLHTKSNLMDELAKVRRVADKGEGTVTEVLLVLDATTGQNGLVQARVFSEVVDVTGVVLTKLDGSAKGGIVVSVQRELGVPVKLVGLGEGPDDLAPFDATAFVDALLG